MSGCCGPGECGGIDRRDFLRAAALAAVAPGLPAIAGPFDHFELVPVEKKLAAGWRRSLFARGEPTVYRGKELSKIGMPVGGIGCGQLYLGGDGKLWYFDIFNTPQIRGDGSGPHYAKPLEPFAPLDQGFALRVGGKTRPLARRGFEDIAFRGQYPIGRVDYRDDDCPVAVALEAFSPFCPLDTDDSSPPATVLNYTLKNTGKEKVDVEIAGWLENAVAKFSGFQGAATLRNRIVGTRLDCGVYPPPGVRVHTQDIPFDDFEKEKYEGWTATGTAFGKGPVEQAKMPEYQGDVGAKGRRLVNTHNTRQGEDVRQGDQHVGTLVSRPFTIERGYISFRIGGGAHKGKTCLNLLVDGKVVRTMTGRNSNRLRFANFPVGEFQGKQARLQIVDHEKGGWGNIGVDDIVFTDRPRLATQLLGLPDYGSLALSVVGGGWGDAEGVFDGPRTPSSEMPLGGKLVGAVGRKLALAPGAETTVTFILAWHFPGVSQLQGLGHITDIARLRRHYAKRFDRARDVAEYVEKHLEKLTAQTRLWRDTWYDSTLPHWFLDRTLLNLSTLATATCYRFDNGRFYGFEGIYCCAGTCTHVWQYAQAVARLFPELERDTRERVDFGLAFRERDGVIHYRAESARREAIDGQAGTILRAYREHQMAPDDAFLKRVWPRVKKALQFLIGQDVDENGVLEGAQYNTLDATWFGPMGWISSLYVAAVRAGEEMARETGDGEFAARCARIAAAGGKNIAKDLFNGEYFIHKPDEKHPEATNTNDGCHIDQVFGQSYAHQLGLGRILPKDKVRSALRALWKYNFTTDIGPYRKGNTVIRGGRWYAMPGEGGLLMCTWPRGGIEKASGTRGNPTFVKYFNECMTGFEYQVAAHMIFDGLVEEGLAVARMIHDRYHAARRNPFNEVECSSHYARAMASFGVFLAACGYEHHGPKGHLGFAPRLSPESFRCAFTAAEGWGTFRQDVNGASIRLRWGRLRLRSLALATKAAPRQVKVTVGGKPVAATHTYGDGRLLVRVEASLAAGEALTVTFSDAGKRNRR